MIFKNSNFSEQTAWISLILTILMTLFYSNGIAQLEGTFSTNAEQVVELWTETVIFSVIFVVIAFVALAIIKKVTGDDEEVALIDERDQQIESKATFWAYFNLYTCIVVMLIHVFCQSIIPSYPFFPNVPPLDFLIHGLMFSGLLVEFIARATQIYCYHRAV